MTSRARPEVVVEVRTDGAGLRVQLLGQPRAWLDGVEIGLGQARQMAVFAILATRGATYSGHRVTVTELLDGVWDGEPPTSARGSVHTYISGLRRALRATGTSANPTELLSFSGNGYQLRLGPGEVDAAEFDREVTQARALVAERPEAALTVLDRALSRWAGDAFLGIPGPYAERERARLEELRLDAVELRADVQLQLGRQRELIPEFTVLTERHPLRESLYAVLMRALYREGRSGEALEVFYTAQRLLRTELGVEPSRALHDLHREILAGSEPEQRWLFVTPGPLPERGQVRLRGREEELELLGELTTAVAAGRGATLLVEGEPGSGKTALLAAALADAEQRGLQLAWAAAGEADRGEPLSSMTRCFGSAATVASGDDESVDAAADRLVELVGKTCSAGPLVVVLDDMQWSDEASVVLWQRLATATRRLPLLLVATVSSGTRRSDLAKVKRCIAARGATVVALSPLSEHDVVGIVEDKLKARVGGVLRSQLRYAADNPLFATVMVDDLLRRDEIHVVDGVADIEPRGPVLSRTLLSTVNRSLRSVPPETLRVLSTAALLGPEFAVTHLMAVADAPPLEVAEHVEAAMAMKILQASDDTLSFRHPLHYEALYARTPESARAAAHRRVAEALATAGCAAERVGQQLVNGPEILDASSVGWLVEHRSELSAGDPVTAATLMRRASDSGVLTREQTAVLLPELVRLLVWLGETPVALAERAVEVATDEVDQADMRKLLAELTRSPRAKGQRALRV